MRTFHYFHSTATGPIDVSSRWGHGAEPEGEGTAMRPAGPTFFAGVMSIKRVDGLAAQRTHHVCNYTYRQLSRSTIAGW